MAAQTMSGFNNEIHLDDLAQYEPKFFEILEHIFKTKDSNLDLFISFLTKSFDLSELIFF